MVLFTAAAVLGSLILLFIIFSKWRYQYWSRKGVAQLEPQLIFGDFRPIANGSMASQVYLLDIYKKAKAKGLKQIGLYNLLSPQWMPLDLNILKHILLKDFDSFAGHGTYIHKNEPLSMLLFSLEGEEWKKLRTKLTPTFTTGKMKVMFDTLLEKTNVLTKVVSKHAERDKEIQIKEILARLGTDVIGSVAFGIECNCLEEGHNKFREIGQQIFQPNLLKILLEDLLPCDLLNKLGHRTIPREAAYYFTEIVKETIKYRSENNVQKKDFMQLMLQLKNQHDDKNYITDQEIITESLVFYLAGFETSSTATTFALLELSRNQDIQDKLRQEIHDALEQADGNITYEVVTQMPYLDCVMREALRKYPPVAIIPRHCTKTYKVPGSDVVIEKGTKLFIPAWGIQKDPEYYPDPEVFNPDNFSPENKAKRPDFTWMPFGEGPRMCIGLRFGMLQSKMSLVTLLKDFRVSLSEKTKWPLEMEKGALVLTAKGDIWLKVNKL